MSAQEFEIQATKMVRLMGALLNSEYFSELYLDGDKKTQTQSLWCIIIKSTNYFSSCWKIQNNGRNGHVDSDKLLYEFLINLYPKAMTVQLRLWKY